MDSTEDYTRRIIDDELDELCGEVAAIAVDGPKGVGKTTTAEQRVQGVLRLDSKALTSALPTRWSPRPGLAVGA